MSQALVLACLMAALVVLDVLAMMFGYDSRDGFGQAHLTRARVSSSARLTASSGAAA
jgi:hypothetical protein